MCSFVLNNKQTYFPVEVLYIHKYWYGIQFKTNMKITGILSVIGQLLLLWLRPYPSYNYYIILGIFNQTIS